MSRTKRCKNSKVKREYYYSREEFEQILNGKRKQTRYPGKTFHSYKEYCKFEMAIAHSDSAHRYYHDGGNIPSDVINCFYERPLRREVKREIRNAIKKDGGESLVHRVPKHRTCTDWWMWD